MLADLYAFQPTLNGPSRKIGAAIAASHVRFVFAAGIVRLRWDLRRLGNTKRIFEACRPGASLTGQRRGKCGPKKRRIRWPDAAARRRRVFGDKVLPNLVLLARELERY